MINENPAYLTKQKIITYRVKNPAVPDDAECQDCGHEYDRHFDWMEDEDRRDVGCKYCGCDDFKWDLERLGWDTPGLEAP